MGVFDDWRGMLEFRTSELIGGMIQGATIW